MFNPLCCCSLRRGAVRLAVCDIILFMLTVVIAVALECFVFKSTPIKILTDVEYEEQDFNLDGKSLWTHVTHAIHVISTFNVMLGYVAHFAGLMAIMGYIILEIWLCCVLIRAATESRPDFCTRWMWWRFLQLIISLGLTSINLFQMQFTACDVAVQPLNVFRLYSLLVVYQLRKKLQMPDEKLVFY